MSTFSDLDIMEFWDDSDPMPKVNLIASGEPQKIYSVRQHFQVPDFPENPVPTTTKKNIQETNECRIGQTYRQVPCRNICFNQRKKSNPSQFCQTHNSYCQSEDENYKAVCAPVWNEKCSSEQEVRVNHLIKLSAEKCANYRLKFANNCVPPRVQDVGHLGAIAKMDKLTKRCSSVESLQLYLLESEIEEIEEIEDNLGSSINYSIPDKVIPVIEEERLNAERTDFKKKSILYLRRTKGFC